ncbi:MAG: NAD(P)/FAD-dependent oxidoreductase [Candidatus Korarchaeum sp.]|nr:NAD(P)/FAD-dependent oxidoreductase [Candidatus Korarchaeum sp.]MDW8035156.1 FAD/NAD(P)-binding oxidoreductase [Candidatus Korarchaeum sp.]
MPKKLVVVGGGDGGTILANRLARRLKRDELEIEVIDKEEAHFYQPGFLFVAFGEMSREIISKPKRGLYSAGVRFTKAEVSKIELGDRKLKLSDGEEKRYDYLVISTGSVLNYDDIKGFREDVNHIWTLEDAEKLYQTLKSFKGGTIVIGVGGLTYKCPVAPLELAFLTEEFLRAKGLRDKTEIKFVSPLERPYGPRLLNRVIVEKMKERRIEQVNSFTVDRIDPQSKEVHSLEGDSLKYDMLILSPPHRGADVILNSGIGDDEGWVPVDKHYLKVKDYDDVFAIGDATNLPVPKTGVIAHFEASTVADNLYYELKGMEKRAMFDGQSFCVIEMGKEQASAQVSNYYYTEAPGLIPTRVLHLAKLSMNTAYWTCVLGGYI